MIGRDTLEVAVYNEAGEVVKHFTQAEIQSLVAGSSGSLLPADFEVGKVKLSSSLISPSYSSSSAPNQTLTVTLGSGRSFTWDGRGDNGNILTSGTYFIEVKSAVEGDPKQQIVVPIHIQGNQSGVAEIGARPKPVKLGHGNTAIFRFKNLKPQGMGEGWKIVTGARGFRR